MTRHNLYVIADLIANGLQKLRVQCHPYVCSEVFSIVWKLHLVGIIKIFLHSGYLCCVNCDFSRGKKWSFYKRETIFTIKIRNEFTVGIYGMLMYLLSESSEKPDKWLFELVVTLGRDVVILQVLFPVECDLLGLHLSILDVDLVANQADWNVLTHSH